MAYETIGLGMEMALLDTTVHIHRVVDDALKRAAENPVHLAEQLRIHYGVFPGLLRTLIDVHGTEGKRQIIADNLHEEDGGGDGSRDHRVMYDRFLSSARSTFGEGRIPSALPEGGNPFSMAIAVGNAMQSVVSSQPYPTAVGAVYGLELRAPHQMEQIRNFYHKLGGSALDLEFFDIHMVDDVEHTEQFRELLVAEVRTPRDLFDAQRGLDLTVVTDQQFWLSVQA